MCAFRLLCAVMERRPRCLGPSSCLWLVRALCAETHEGWLEDHRYVNMDFLMAQKMDLLHAAA